jgi:hypothetical protein
MQAHKNRTGAQFDDAKREGEHREPRTTQDSGCFEGIRELVAKTHAAPEARNGALLESISITCQAGGMAHNGAYCQQCARFVNWVPSLDRSAVTIRCLWSESDLAGDLMACISTLVTTSPETPVAEAAAEARRLHTSYMMVESDGRFEGVIYLRDVDESGLVRERMIRPTWHVPPTATLGEVVALMLAHDADFVPVVSDDALLGLLTRADLVNAGLESAFGAR